MSEKLPETSQEQQNQRDIDAYMHRYDTSPDWLVVEQPHVPTASEIEPLLNERTNLEVADIEEYRNNPNSLLRKNTVVTLPLEEVRQAFDGSDSQLYDAITLGQTRGGGVYEKLELSEERRRSVLEGAKSEVIPQLAETIEKRNFWSTSDILLRQDIEDGRFNQYFEVTTGEHAIKVLNCDRPLEEAEVTEITDVIEHLITASKGAIFDKLDVVLLQHHDRFKARDENMWVVGKAHSAYKLFRANTVLRDLAHIYEQKPDTFTLQVPGWTKFQKTLAHEIAHLLDDSEVDVLQSPEGTISEHHSTEEDMFSDISHGIFTAPLGWSSKQYEVTAPEGTGKTHVVRGTSKPSDLWVEDDKGVDVRVNPNDYFGEDVVNSSAPVSEYGHTNAREDFAEAFAQYALAGPEELEPVRRHIIGRAIVAMAKNRDGISVDGLHVEEKLPSELALEVQVPDRALLAVRVETAPRHQKALPWIQNPDIAEGFFVYEDEKIGVVSS